MRDHPILLDQTEVSRLGPQLGRGFVSLNPFANLQVDQSLIDKLNSMGSATVVLAGLSLPPPLVLVTRHEFDLAFGTDEVTAWAQFAAHFPGVSRIVTLSRPAFSADGTSALVSIQKSAVAPCCSDGYTAYVKKDGGSWKVVAYGGYWVT